MASFRNLLRGKALSKVTPSVPASALRILSDNKKRANDSSVTEKYMTDPLYNFVQWLGKNVPKEAIKKMSPKQVIQRMGTWVKSSSVPSGAQRLYDKYIKSYKMKHERQIEEALKE